MARRKLFTIGYEQTPAKAVLDELERTGVKLLVDVRAVAASRRPGFSKNQLAAGLDERGISYLHLRGLCEAPEDAASEGRTRRAVGAGQKIRTGLHSLLRARSPALPPAMDRRNHRRPRRREGGKSGRAAGVIVIPGRREASNLESRDSGSGANAPSRNDGRNPANPASLLPGPPKRSFHHLHASPADMRGHDNAVRFADAGQQQARPVHIDALPDAQLEFAIPLARQVGE